MSKAALLALWNDVAQERRAEYERWHTLEHVPERVWVPGFVRGTRYVRLAGALPRYFTLYEMESLACLESPAYRSLVDEPTPWSRAMRPFLRDFLRKPAEVGAKSGHGLARGVLTLRSVWQGGHPSLNALAASLLKASEEWCATGVEVCKVAAAGPQALRNEDDAPEGIELVTLVHITDCTRTDSLAEALGAVLLQQGRGPVWSQWAGYELVSTVGHADVAAPQRPPPMTSQA